MKFIRRLFTWSKPVSCQGQIDPVKAERERISGIVAACALAGRAELAGQYIDDPEATVAGVQKELRRMKGQPSSCVPRVARQFADITVDDDIQELAEEEHRVMLGSARSADNAIFWG